MPSDEPSRHYNWRLKSLAKLKYLYFAINREICYNFANSVPIRTQIRADGEYKKQK